MLQVQTNIVKPEKRQNTYRNEDFFKVVVLTPNRETSETKGKWLSNSNLKSNQLTYKGPYNQTTLVAYGRWPQSDNTQQASVGIDAVIIFCETEEEFNKIRHEVESSCKYVPVRALISDNQNSKNWASSIGAISLSSTSQRDEVLKKLDNIDLDEYSKIIRVIDKYDKDKSGTIDIKEMPEIATELGENPESLKEAMLALDINHDNILDVDEFIKWWKIGRNNLQALSKIYELNQSVNTTIQSIFNNNNLKKDMLGTANNKDTVNNLEVNIDTGDLEDVVTRLILRLTCGGEMKREAIRNFLSKFTNVHHAEEDNWINISVFVKSLSYKGTDLKEFLEHFRENLIEYAEKNFLSGLSNFIRDFVMMKFYPQDYSATIIFQFKHDVYSLIKDALAELFTLVDYVTDKGKSSFDFNLTINSGGCIGDAINKDKYVGSFLELSEVNVEYSGLKNRVKTLVTNLNEKHKNLQNLLQFLFVPSNMKLNFKGPISDLFNENGASSLKLNMGFLKPLLTFLKGAFHGDLLRCISRIELGLNMYDIFANVQIFSDNLWNESSSDGNNEPNTNQNGQHEN